MAPLEQSRERELSVRAPDEKQQGKIGGRAVNPDHLPTPKRIRWLDKLGRKFKIYVEPRTPLTERIITSGTPKQSEGESKKVAASELTPLRIPFSCLGAGERAAADALLLSE